MTHIQIFTSLHHVEIPDLCTITTPSYGIIVADNGASGGLIGTPDARWNDTALSLVRGITLGDFEPVDVSGLIVDNDSGMAKQQHGTTTGQNRK